ncbi:hypothetical protein M9H77_13571 [Catharanthus roseus]|uniref:Uncharacterized protein n=1 Tax=Catharanthus roseus TaxID=4058 RepID=A0ACC0BKJ3_CATRO|nr:hypothetical protein M9H77_13571 [Catharanthus roseus]
MERIIAPELHSGESTKPYFLIFANITGLVSIKELHCTWLAPRTRASSNGVDDLDLEEWIHLKRGIDRGERGPISLCGHCIMFCGRTATLWRARRGLKLRGKGEGFFGEEEEGFLGRRENRGGKALFGAVVGGDNKG